MFGDKSEKKATECMKNITPATKTFIRCQTHLRHFSYWLAFIDACVSVPVPILDLNSVTQRAFCWNICHHLCPAFCLTLTWARPRPAPLNRCTLRWLAGFAPYLHPRQGAARFRYLSLFWLLARCWAAQVSTRLWAFVLWFCILLLGDDFCRPFKSNSSVRILKN